MQIEDYRCGDEVIHQKHTWTEIYGKIITLIGNNNAFSICNIFCLTVTIALQKSDKAI